MVIVASGCSTLNSSFGPEKSMFGENRVTTASANQMFSSDFEKFDDKQLIYMLNQGKVQDTSVQNENLVNQLSDAFKNANKSVETTPALALRSQIQDRLIAASNQRCNLYTTYLKRLSAKNNGIFGTLTTVLGGAGAIVTGAHAARLLSGLAGISSGTRAELNQAIFESVATSVIVPAIDKNRAAILKEIQDKRTTGGARDKEAVPLEVYTIEGAVADAIRYHGACSMAAGIAFAQKQIQSFDDVGMKKFLEIKTEFEKAGIKVTTSPSPDSTTQQAQEGSTPPPAPQNQ
jgi:hypothetical protein